MKKLFIIVFAMLTWIGISVAGNKPHGHTSYVRHQKHHHSKVYHPSHRINPAYQN
ncbi:MAG: hypothetical protein MUE33_11850 [Cytophagaceae bacterium]|jgi:hypothetical protein|nr:hypothetical protein [Cytophagaceae bacterium]